MLVRIMHIRILYLLLSIFAILYFLISLQHVSNKNFTISEGEQLAQQDWQNVSGSSDLFIVYSAYAIVDRFPIEEVLIIGATTRETEEKVICCYTFGEADDDNNRDTEEIPGMISNIPDNLGKRYSAVFITCPLPSSWRPDTVSVLLTTERDSEPSNEIRIQYKSEPRGVPESDEYNYTFSVCVNPSYDYNNAFHFIEWLEFYKLMGVEQFTVYNVTVGPDVTCILNDLADGSDPSIKVNVFPWHNVPIPTEYPRLIKGYCSKCVIAAGSNDCLYRHRGRLTKYLVYVDFDEFIMPRENVSRNYHEMMSLLESEYAGDDISEFLFQNSFFILTRPDDPSLPLRCADLIEDPEKYRVCLKSYMMRKVERNDYYPFRSLSKYIMKPEGVKQSDIHCTLKLEQGYGSVNVSENIAFSHHYRNWPTVSRFPTAGVERVSQDFGMKLVENIAYSLSYFKEKCKFNTNLFSPYEGN